MQGIMEMCSVDNEIRCTEVLAKVRDKLCVRNLLSILPSEETHGLWLYNFAIQERTKAPTQ
jgi:hypothetical protein